MNGYLKTKRGIVTLTVFALLLCALALCCVFLRGDGTQTCHTCDGTGISDGVPCDDCGGSGSVAAESMYSDTFVALVAPLVAIILALITKEVYSSLFIGLVLGGFLYGNFNVTASLDAIVGTGLTTAIADTAGIFLFLVILGIMVILINKAGGSYAFGRWAQTHVKTRVGAILTTFALGILIFIDDYFNCLTVGSVMRPLTDTHKISRVKLAYIIDATAAPVCMIAPISSWAAAVSKYAEDGQGFTLFVQAIPFNFYSLLTLVFIVTITLLGFDYGKMSGFEIKAQRDGDLGEGTAQDETETGGHCEHGRVIDLVLPILVLIVSCVFALVYVGGFFNPGGANYGNFIAAFGDTDAYVALPWGGLIALVFTVIYLMLRRLVSFRESMDAVPKGFVAMVPAILILTFATALKNMTAALGAKYFVRNLMENAQSLASFLPAIIFLVACVLAFATGTSWGTFGILIPIVTAIFVGEGSEAIRIVGISACLAGAVCGDHCSPISDTTIMSSAGARCNHVDHVATQLPYAITVAAVSFVSYIIAGFVPNAWIALPISVVLMVATLFVIRAVVRKKNAAR